MKLPEKVCCNCTSKSPLFMTLSDDELMYISEHKIPVSYKAGETIVKQNFTSLATLALCLST